jgi:excisionase family DNA binding protein
MKIKKLETIAESTGIDVKTLHEVHGFTVTEAADILGISYTYLYDLLNKGRITYRKYGGKRVLTLDDITAYARKSKKLTISELKK